MTVFILIVGLLVICISLIKMAHIGFVAIPRSRRNYKFNRMILDAMYEAGNKELNVIRDGLGKVSKQDFNRKIDEFEIRSKRRNLLYRRLEDLNREIENPFSDAEYEFLTEPVTDEWQEVFSE